ncbi:hypothetical protein Hanom_Chr17g01579881 [Helianthus anomalus]
MSSNLILILKYENFTCTDRLPRVRKSCDKLLDLGLCFLFLIWAVQIPNVVMIFLHICPIINIYY